MKWISIKDEKPKNNESVLIALLTEPANAPSYYRIRLSVYCKNETADNWSDQSSNSSNSFFEPTHWQSLPSVPSIKYLNRPKDCVHDWYENSNNRYCYKCGTVQKEMKKERVWK
ncbi:hypothetical protein LCGC14_1093440 [marine sediment metagenome]|uniref:DUF551 domain-containing protein n=1 Tax=marine sediment metagenome TaxID=412755 RepID=A0A0F9MG42_9ZZZZ